MKAIDLFAGPGGWDLALHSLGVEPLGIEWDDAAVATRAAAGLRTKQADVSEVDPLDFAPCELLIGSPPCPTFSAAGKGDGIADMPLVYEAATAAARGKPVPPLPWRDERSALVVEPLRWAILLEPRFLAWEQVPSVLPFWEHCAEILRLKGWSVWTGKVEAERYGVPQTRERAILMADRETPIHPPKPTHQRYVKGEPQRYEVTMEGEVLPWVSMAEALGWVDGVEPSPSPTVSGGGTGSGGGVEVFAGAAARRRVLRSGQSVGGGDRAERDAGEPAVTITSRADNNKWVYDRRQQNGDGSPVPPVPPVPTSEPAPTLTANGLAKSTHQWIRAGHTNANSPEFDAAERPARTVAGDVSKWTYERPASTIRGSNEVTAPTNRDRDPSWQPGDPDLSQATNAIRVTEEEALILQTFPPDYPVQGTKSQRFTQIGNAVPPLLAHAILSSLLAPVLEQPRELAA